jgi:hypothetical protein
METALAVFVRFYRVGGGDVGRWQNFFINKTVSGFAHKVFDIGSVILNRSAGESGLFLEMPTTKANVDFVEAAINDSYLARVEIYELPATSIPANLNGATVVSTFVGEIVTASLDVQVLKVELGSAMDAVTGDIPGRKITTSLVGRLPKL